MNELLHAISKLSEEQFTPDELAEHLKLHPTTIRKLFVDEPGVIRLGHLTSRKKRQYFTLRIPASVAERVFSRMRVGGAYIGSQPRKEG